jgi:hypothetical protein
MRRGFITVDAALELAAAMGKSSYGASLRRAAEEFREAGA